MTESLRYSGAAPGKPWSQRELGRPSRLERPLKLVLKHALRFLWRRACFVIGLALIFLVAGVGEAAPETEVRLLTEAWRWVRFTTEDGLPSNRIRQIVEARDGTTWVSTSSGIAWFDGYRWRPMGQTEGLPTKAPQRITADAASGILAVIDGGLHRGDRTGFRRVSLATEDGASHVRVAVPLPGGGLLILIRDDRTGRGSLHKFEGDDAGALREPCGPEDVDVYNLWMVSPHDLWILTSEGYFRGEGGSWKYQPTVPGRPYGIAHFKLEDGTGWRCLGRQRESLGLWTWTTRTPPEAPFDTAQVRLDALGVSSEGTVLMVEDSGTVRVRQNEAWSELQPTPPQLMGVKWLRFQSDGDLWVGTDQGLFLHRATSRLWEHWRNPSAESRNRVHEIVEARDGRVWIASGGGVEVHSPDGRVERIAEINGTAIGDTTGLAQDRDGAIWLTSGSTYEGAFRFDGSSWSYFGPQQGLHGFRHKVRTDCQGRPWFLGLGTSQHRECTFGTGAALYVDGGFTHWTTAEGLVHNRVFAFAEGLEGAFWFGTLGGLSRWQAGRWTHWTTANGLREARIWTLAVDETNRVWFSDEWNGLGTIDEDTVRYLTSEDGLPCDEVQEVRADPRGGIWITCHGGVARLENGQWYEIPASKGIGQPRLWPILPTAERVFIGTLGAGTAVLNRAELGNLALDVWVAEPLMRDGSATIRWHAAAPDTLISTEEIETRYRLDDGSWSGWLTQQAATVDVSPGPHAFIVQARDYLTESPIAEEHRSFTVPFPIHRHPLVVSLTLVAFFAVASLTGVVLVRRRRSHEELEACVEARTRDLSEANRRLEREIGERRKTEDALYHARQEWEHIFRAIGQPTVILDGDHRIAAANDAVIQASRRPSHELVGRKCWEIFHGPEFTGPPAGCPFEQMQQSAHLQTVEMELETLGGVYLVSCTPVCSNGGRLENVIHIATDITERKQAEEAARRAQEELLAQQRHEKERVEALLTKAREELVRQTQLATLGQLAGSIAHELRNPLGAVRNAAYFLKGEMAGQDYSTWSRHLRIIDDEVRTCDRIISSLLEMTRGRYPHKRKVDLGAVIEAAWKRADLPELFSRQLDLASDPFTVDADPDQLGQVLSNLLVNAKQAMGGRGAIRVAARHRGEVYEILVRDSGPGVDPENRARIFEPLFSTKAKGTGLGLAICKQIVERHGGTIDLVDDAAPGAAFAIRLPRKS